MKTFKVFCMNAGNPVVEVKATNKTEAMTLAYEKLKGKFPHVFFVGCEATTVLGCFTAKFTNDVCPKCGEDIVAGESVKWTDTHRNKLMHADCEPMPKSPIPAEVENELYDTFMRCQLYADVSEGEQR